MGASEGGVIQHETVNSADSVTSLGDSRAVSAADPSRVLDSILPQNSKNVQNNPNLADLSYEISSKADTKAKNS